MNSQSNIKIAKRWIGAGQKPFVIAEMSGNHNKSLDNALRIVEAAAKSGVDAIKIQTYTPDTMTLDIGDREFFIKDADNPWAGRSLYSLYAEAHTPWEWHKPIFSRARELGLIAFSTPFDFTSVDFLEELDNPCYKIASFENTDLNLIAKVASTGKPLIISTGMATIAELSETVQCAKDHGCNDLILLKCTSAYPSPPESANLLTLPHLRDLFNCVVGLSDHTMGIGVAIASVALGATVIEKHFTINRADGGIDSAFSMEPEEMQQLVIEVERAQKSIGRVVYGATEEERNSIIFRRSIYIVKDLKKGEILTEKNMRCIRPGYGLPPKFFTKFLGLRVAKDVQMGTPLSFELLEDND